MVENYEWELILKGRKYNGICKENKKGIRGSRSSIKKSAIIDEETSR